MSSKLISCFFICLLFFPIVLSFSQDLVLDEKNIFPYETSETIDGYWLFRSPVYSEDLQIGDSYARRFGEEKGNGQDIGVLWRQDTFDDEGGLLKEEERHCGAWVQYFFDEPGISDGQINNIYCHVWVSSPYASLGISENESYNVFDWYKRFDLRNEEVLNIGRVNHFNLMILYDSNFNYSFSSEEEFHDLSFKGVASNIQVLSYPDQKSFCIINLDENLEEIDTDGDGLNDYNELFVKYTDPYDADTDEDGNNDLVESQEGKEGWDPYDYYNIHVYNLGDYFSRGFVSILSNQLIEPFAFSFEDELQRELNFEEYLNIEEYDGSSVVLESNSSGGNLWVSSQFNFNFKISENLEEIKRINIIYGGRVTASGGGIDKEFNSYEIKRNFNQEPFILPGKKWVTPALFIKKIKSASEIVDEGSNIYVRIFTKASHVPYGSIYRSLVGDFIVLEVFTEKSIYDKEDGSFE